MSPGPRRRPHGRGGRFLVVLAGAVLAVATACSGDDGASGSTTTATSTTAAPPTTAVEGPPVGATELGLRDAEVGQCFDTMEGTAGGDRAVWQLDCATPHTHEIFEVLDYDGEGAGGGGAPYPGLATVQNWAEQACYDRFEAFVGVRWTLSELDIEVWWPSEESWGRADRSVICTVLSSTGDRLEGTQRGSAR